MKKIIIFSLIILFFTKTQNVLSSTNTFTVDNIEVSGEIRKDIPRERYLNIAFRKGLFKESYLSSIKINGSPNSRFSYRNM